MPLVVVLAMRYNLDIEGSASGDPVEVVLHDRAFLGMALLYVAVLLLLFLM